MKTLLYFKNRIQPAVKPINVGLTAGFIFLTVKDGILYPRKTEKSTLFLKNYAKKLK